MATIRLTDSEVSMLGYDDAGITEPQPLRASIYAKCHTSRGGELTADELEVLARDAEYLDADGDMHRGRTIANLTRKISRAYAEAS